VRTDLRLGECGGRRRHPRALSSDRRANPLRPEILVPVVMGCAMLWWVSRGMTWTTRLVVAAVTLVLIVGILLFEHSGF
jgi:hypothetical protein